MRKALGDTQSEFAERYDIPFRTIQNWESGVRKSPEYVTLLLESRVRSDLCNRKTYTLPKYDKHKKELPKRSSFVGAVAWLQAVRESLGPSFIFALDEALMCQGNFGGRSNEYIVWGYGDNSASEFNGVVLLGNSVNESGFMSF
jgi:transcriptional regulator with XRE-family HTH domain